MHMYAFTVYTNYIYILSTYCIYCIFLLGLLRASVDVDDQTYETLLDIVHRQKSIKQ